MSMRYGKTKFVYLGSTLSLASNVVIDRVCPQEGVLSSTLWNLVINELISLLNGEGFLAIGYADGIVVLVVV